MSVRMRGVSGLKNVYSMSAIQHIAPKAGNIGTKGALNGRGLSGSVYLSIITPIHTIAKAVKVPTLQSSAALFISRNNVPIAIKLPVTIVMT